MNYSIELMRLFAIILITLTHTRHNLNEDGFYYLIEEIPKQGTILLSIISGYLFFKTTSYKESNFLKKIKTLLIPYIISNLFVLIFVLIFNYFGNNTLNRLTYDSSLITEGLFSLNSPPINPPTYFIRDLFIVFVLCELIIRRNLKMLFIIIPLLIFGKLMLRYDILILFVLGMSIAFINFKNAKIIYLTTSFLLFIISFWFFNEYSKYFVPFFIFIILIDFPFKFHKTGGYSYLLHLYHAPIFVISYPIISLFIKNQYLNIISQIILALTLSYLLFIITRKFKFLKIISGGR